MDSDERPLNHVRYQSANANPYGGDPYYNGSQGYLPTPMPKKRVSNWIKFGVPVAILVIIAAVVGAVVGVKKHNDNAAASSASNSNPSAAASSAVGVKASVGRFATATDSNFFQPIYPSTVRCCCFKSFLALMVSTADEHCCLHHSYLHLDDRLQSRFPGRPVPALQPLSHHGPH